MSARPIPEHGTQARYKGNQYVEPCRCDACRKDACRRALACAAERLAGNPRRVPTKPVWNHVIKLRAAGLNDAEIGRAAGLNRRGAIAKIGQQKTVGRDIARAVLAIPLTQRDNEDTVLAVGATRRIRALMAIGHAGTTIAERAHTEHWRIFKLTSGLQVRISRSLDTAIRDAYRELCKEPGACPRIATIATRNGWHGPLAWDDIDDPTEQPDAELHLAPRQEAKERTDDIVLLASAGAQPEQIAERLGVTTGYVRKRLRTKHRALYLALTA